MTYAKFILEKVTKQISIQEKGEKGDLHSRNGCG